MAPSPTGMLHVGTAHTTLFNYLFARHHGGNFILRIEDTDPERSKKEFEKNIIDELTWLGIEWDGEITRQSEMAHIYKPYLERMLREGTAFYCPHSEEELTKEKAIQMANKESPKHVCEFRDKQAENGIIRIKNNAEDTIVFTDKIRGKISFDPKLLGDFSLARSLESALYHFAVVIDDTVMDITHVIRGEDHISNTPKHILIQRALELPSVTYAHLSLLLGPDRSKLSKRHGATSVTEYREDGYFPEALLNFLALLGWNPGTDQEIFSKEALIKEFSLDRVQKAGAIFDAQKLDWMNGEYIKKMPPEKLAVFATPYLAHRAAHAQASDAYVRSVVALEQPRLKKLSELGERTKYFFEEPAVDANLLRWKKISDAAIRQSLTTARTILESIPEKNFTKENLEKILLAEAEKSPDRGELLWPLRAALSGQKSSPSPFEIATVMGKEKTLARISAALGLFL